MQASTIGKTGMANAICSVVLCMALPLAAQTHFGTQTPSVTDIISNLEEREGSVIDGVRTRAIYSGAATQATAEPEAAPAPPPKAPAISMQIQFEFGSDRIGGYSVKTMENLAAALQSPQLQGRAFTVVGHTDAVGSAEYNLRLSQRRAAAVKSWLVERGVDAARLTTTGRGFDELLDPSNPRAACIATAALKSSPAGDGAAGLGARRWQYRWSMARCCAAALVLCRPC